MYIQHSSKPYQVCLLSAVTTYFNRFLFEVMMTSSNRNTFCVTGPECGEFIDHRWLPLTQASEALTFSLICSWTNGWVNRWFETPPHSLWRHRNALPSCLVSLYGRSKRDMTLSMYCIKLISFSKVETNFRNAKRCYVCFTCVVTGIYGCTFVFIAKSFEHIMGIHVLYFKNTYLVLAQVVL